MNDFDDKRIQHGRFASSTVPSDTWGMNWTIDRIKQLGAGRPVRLRFVVRDVKLYAFQFGS